LSFEFEFIALPTSFTQIGTACYGFDFYGAPAMESLWKTKYVIDVIPRKTF
jgi:hypothetical protein